MKRLLATSILCASFLIASNVFAGTKKIPANSKIYIAPMDGFETYVAAAIKTKNVPVVVVADRDKADYEIRGSSETEKAGWAKTIFINNRSNEQASITLVDVKTSDVVFAYAVKKLSAYRGKQSSAEACAKHLKDYVEKAK